jgi:hypothetical protein
MTAMRAPFLASYWYLAKSWIIESSFEYKKCTIGSTFPSCFAASKRECSLLAITAAASGSEDVGSIRGPKRFSCSISALRRFDSPMLHLGRTTIQDSISHRHPSRRHGGLSSSRSQELINSFHCSCALPGSKSTGDRSKLMRPSAREKLDARSPTQNSAMFLSVVQSIVG